MSNEELLKPRYKVIADMPLLRFKIGDIHNAHFIPINIWDKETYVRLDIYPHLFRKLEWWEERQPEEVPAYIKFNYPFSPNVQLKEYSDTFDILAGTKMICKYLPATKE